MLIFILKIEDLWVLTGDDGIKKNKADRNEFNAKYYKDNNLTLYLFATNITDDLLEVANLQTLFGKDYYVILRPSLSFNFPNINVRNNIIIIVSLIFIFIIEIFKNEKARYRI